MSILVTESPVRELFPGIRMRPLWTEASGAPVAVPEKGTPDVPEPCPEG
ncbi:hypothetical protein [Sciscionella marina]|nr:hypothetical protein [Sciscionella marina]